MMRKWEVEKTSPAALHALFAALMVAIAEIDEYGPGELSTQRFLDRVGEYLEEPERNLPRLLLDEETSLHIAFARLQSGVARSRQLLDFDEERS